MYRIKFSDRCLVLKTPQVMGILNVTPDSFSDGGRFNHIDAALKQAEAMAQAGATFVDVGGESTRPGAKAVSAEEELERVIPVIEKIKANLDVLVSLDTCKSEVMAEGIRVGADLINDVKALTAPGAIDVLANCKVPVCLMHMQGEPRTMQTAPQYDDVVSEVRHFFEDRIDACVNAGIERSRILIDPGFGFGKTPDHNYQLLNRLDHFHELDRPILVGLSRKSMIGHVLNKPVEERLVGSIAGAVVAAMKGCHIIRVHDVSETVEAMKIVNATLKETA
ncbi:dihydropteroate synthase [Corallincola platygyrae]|uniref:Dihydropteroate synthase n=1 Tax=Corallincola platygyrae TaxID=1193278 RepID=A0ABW4XIL2_9GAMM